LTWLDMVQHASSTTSHIATIIAQKKTWSYTKNDFTPPPIEPYGCLHYCLDSLFTTCVQATIAHLWSLFSSCNVYFLLLIVFVHGYPSNMWKPLWFFNVLPRLRCNPHLFHTSQLVHFHY
jgi:hypothetical protein